MRARHGRGSCDPFRPRRLRNRLRRGRNQRRRPGVEGSGIEAEDRRDVREPARLFRRGDVRNLYGTAACDRGACRQLANPAAVGVMALFPRARRLLLVMAITMSMCRRALPAGQAQPGLMQCGDNDDPAEEHRCTEDGRTFLHDAALGMNGTVNTRSRLETPLKFRVFPGFPGVVSFIASQSFTIRVAAIVNRKQAGVCPHSSLRRSSSDAEIAHSGKGLKQTGLWRIMTGRMGHVSGSRNPERCFGFHI